MIKQLKRENLHLPAEYPDNMNDIKVHRGAFSKNEFNVRQYCISKITGYNRNLSVYLRLKYVKHSMVGH
jgi:hypothetical protein